MASDDEDQGISPVALGGPVTPSGSAGGGAIPDDASDTNTDTTPAAQTSGFDPRVSPWDTQGKAVPPPEPTAVQGNSKEDRDAARQRQRDFIPNLIKSGVANAQSNTSPGSPGNSPSPGGQLLGAMQGANENMPENEQQGGGMQLGAKVMRYLAGADAADPAQAQQLEQQVDPQGQMTPGQRHLLAVDMAAQHGGDESAWPLVALHTKMYNAKMAFAHAALNGTPTKPPDIGAATQAATDAHTHMLDGNETKFAPAGGGVTATVTTPSGQTQQTPLTVPQFNQATDVGDVKGGQYDATYENHNQLQQIAQGPGKPPAPMGAQGAQGAQGASAPQAPLPGSSVNLDGSRTMGRTTPAPADPGQGRPFQYPGDQDMAEQLTPQQVAMSHRIFPSVGQEPQRQQWLAGLMATKQAQAAKLEEVKNTRLYGAQATAQGRETVAAGNNASRETIAGGNNATKEQIAGGAQQTRRDVVAAQQGGATDRATAALNQKAQQFSQTYGRLSGTAANQQTLSAARAVLAANPSLDPNTPAFKTAMDGVMKELGSNGGAPPVQQQGASAAPRAPAAPSPGASPSPQPQQGAPVGNGITAAGGKYFATVNGAKVQVKPGPAGNGWVMRGPNGEAVPYQPQQ